MRHALIVTDYWAPRRGPTSNAWRKRWGATPDKAWLHATQEWLSGVAPVGWDWGSPLSSDQAAEKTKKKGKTNEKQSQKKQENEKSKCKHRGEVIEASIEPSTMTNRNQEIRIPWYPRPRSQSSEEALRPEGSRTFHCRKWTGCQSHCFRSSWTLAP